MKKLNKTKKLTIRFKPEEWNEMVDLALHIDKHGFASKVIRDLIHETYLKIKSIDKST